MKLPQYIADIIKPAPEGYKWVYRGKNWKAKNVFYVFYDDFSIFGYDDIEFAKTANGYYYEYIELVKIEHDMNSPLEQIEFAKSLVGKRVSGENTGYPVYDKYKGVVAGYKFIDLKNGHCSCNPITRKSLEKGWSVVVWMEKDMSYLPVEYAKIMSDSKTIPLTSDYDVKIYKDRVEVGCQTVSKEKLEEIMSEMEKL